jgi:ubiquinone/menaquinone biosynthesis C-methylase UbiE
MLSKYIASQLRKPSGFIGKVVFARLLNRENIRMNQSTLDALDVNNNESILEIGFGGGGLLEMILKKNDSCIVHGADISPEMVSFCENKLKKYISKNRLRITCSSISNLPYGDESFSKVCSVNNLYFWPNVENSLLEILRVLKKDGQVVITVETKISMEKHDCTKHNFRLLERSEIENSLNHVGFGNVETFSCKSITYDYVAIIGRKL